MPLSQALGTLPFDSAQDKLKAQGTPSNNGTFAEPVEALVA